MDASITGFYSSLLAVVYIYLSGLIISQRFKKQIGIGDGGDSDFQRLIRAHGNFAEYAPIALILLLVGEVNQLSPIVLHAAGTAIFFGRLLHAFGLRLHSGTSWQRQYGTILTYVSMLIMSVANIVHLYN